MVIALWEECDLTRPWNDGRTSGNIEGILIAPAAEAPLSRVPEAGALAGRGLEGGRHVDRRGTFSGGNGYDLTLIEAEALEQLAADSGIHITLKPSSVDDSASVKWNALDGGLLSHVPTSSG